MATELYSAGILFALLAAAVCYCNAAGNLSVSVVAESGRFVSELSDLVLRCNVSETPDYLFWYYSAVPQGTDRAALVRCHWESSRCLQVPGFSWTNVVGGGDGTLRLSGLARSQDGYYECEAFRGSIGAKEGVRVVVVVPGSPPTIAQSPDSMKAGDRATLTCSTSGWNPPAELTWLRIPLGGGIPKPVNLTTGSGHTVSRSPPKEKFGNVSSSLELTVDSADDETVIVCVASQNASNASSSAELKLRVQHQPTVGSIADVTAVEGNVATISCPARGYPTPRLQLISSNGSVMLESANGLFTLSPVDRTQAGTISCRATNALGTASTAFLFAVLYPPSVRTPSTAVANEGEPALLPCTVSGNPPPSEVVWRHSATGAVISPDRGTADLRIVRAEPSLSGEWRCEARAVLAATSGPPVEYRASAAIRLTVRYRPGPPAVSQPRVPFASGVNVNLTCLPNAESPGEPPPSLRWGRTDRPAAGWSGQSGPSLLLNPVSLADNGAYVCTASNDLGASQSAPISLQVLQAPRFAAASGQPIRARLGDENFSLACRASANPRPRLRWLRGGVPVVSGLVYTELLELASDPFVFQVNLHFRGSQRSSVRLNDTGAFQCEAVNELGNATLTVQMEVRTEPLIVNAHSKTARLSGRPLACQFLSHPGYRVTWLTPDGSRLPSKASYATAVEPWRLSAPAPAGPLGNYTCRVENSIGAAERRLELVDATVPDPPSRLRASALGWDGVRLAWTPGFDGGHPARLRLRFAGWNATAGLTSATLAEADSAAGQVTVGGLYPDTAYTVTCWAENLLGVGPTAPDIIVVTGHLRLPQVSEARWDPAAGRLAFQGVPGLCARVEASADGGVTWGPADAAGGCLAYRPEGASVAASAATAAAASPTNLYRVSLCLGNRTDVCGPPFTAYPLALSENVPLSTIIIVASVCAVVIIALITVLIWLCMRRRNAAAAKAATTKAAQRQRQDYQASAAGNGSAYKQGLKANNSNSFGGVSNGGPNLHQSRQHPAVAFVPPTSMTDGRGNRVSETRFGGLDCADGVAGSSPHLRSSSPEMGTVHLFPTAFYESDGTDNSGSPPTPTKQHRKVIYEVVV